MPLLILMPPPPALPAGNFWSAYSDNAGIAWPATDSGIAALWCCVRYDRQESSTELWAWLQSPAGGIVRYKSTNEGNTWLMPQTISTGVGNRTPFAVVERNGLKYQYWIRPNGAAFDVHGRIDDRTGNVVVAEFTAIAGVDDAGGATDGFVITGGKRRLRIWVILAGVLTAFLSDEGVVFA